MPADPPIINPIRAFCAMGGRSICGRLFMENKSQGHKRFFAMEEPPAKRLKVELTNKEKEIIVDNARCHGTFDLIMI